MKKWQTCVHSSTRNVRGEAIRSQFLHGTTYSLFQMIARKMKLMRSEVWYLWICSWMLEIHHKQAEVVVSRVLSEKLLLKNKTLANEYKKLKV